MAEIGVSFETNMRSKFDVEQFDEVEFEMNINMSGALLLLRNSIVIIDNIVVLSLASL